MRYFVDMLYPPTVTQARSMRRNGWTGCAVYVGGPRAAAHRAWHQIDGALYPVRDLVDVFDFFVPISVGRNAEWDSVDAFTYGQGVLDGAAANVDTGACGFGPHTPLGLDLEYGTWQAHPDETHQYLLGWVSAVNAAGHPVPLYSDLETLSHVPVGTEIDYKWGAAWVKGYASAQAPIGQFDPASPPPWDLWQFGQTSIAGVQCDANSAVDSFQGASYG